MSRISKQQILDRYGDSSCRRGYTWQNYQPIPLPGYEKTILSAGRNCFDRGEAVAASIKSHFGDRHLKIIDWGCNLGFFVFQLAKLGHEVVGVDSNAKYVETCRFLAETNHFPIQPRFYVDELTESNLTNYSGFDLAICFSVLHHLGHRILSTLKKFSELYPVAFIEMDGRNFGHCQIFPFYFHLEQIAETNDPYGQGTRRRKTWLCRNSENDAIYSNLKCRNLLPGRSVLKKSRGNCISVVKRETSTSRHTWIQTDLRHEQQNYQAWGGSEFFPKLINCGESRGHRWIELEYVEDDKTGHAEPILRFFEFLKEHQLFMMDLSSDSFLFSKGNLKVVDLESLFVIQTSIADLVSQRTRKPELVLFTYEQQIQFVMQKCLGSS